MGLNVHTVLKMLVSTDLVTDARDHISGAVDLRWILDIDQQNAKPELVLDIPKEVR